MSDQNVQELLEKLLKGEITAAEQEALAAWINTPENTERAEPLLEAAWQQFEPSGKMDESRSEAILSGILDRPGKEAQVIRRSFFRKYWWAAAAVMVLAGSTWLLLTPGKKTEETVAVTDSIQPGSDGAILTLADGRKIVLDSLNNGKIADQNGTVINLADGQLTYDPAGTATETVSYNTMSTPRGRQFQLVLPDGTHVWLNAASSIRYPTAFRAHERSVEITGEAYFEVASHTDPSAASQLGKGKKPFYVISRNQRIAVTGTQFNVNAYDDEAIVTTTLFDGKVLVTPSFNENSTSSSAIALAPGEQLQVRNDLSHEKFSLDAAQLSQASAWKNGLFDFGNTHLDAVLRQLSRWYDVDVVYEGALPNRQFGGEMERSLSFRQVLNILETVGVKYRLEGNKKLIIL